MWPLTSSAAGVFAERVCQSEEASTARQQFRESPDTRPLYFLLGTVAAVGIWPL